MENETYASEASPERIDEVLEWIARELKERYGVRVWFAEILGKRWSYRAGVGNEFPTPLEHIMITPRFGMVVEGWRKIPEEDRSALLTFLRGYLAGDKTGAREASPWKRES
jgi:hypothetical protein